MCLGRSCVWLLEMCVASVGRKNHFSKVCRSSKQAEVSKTAEKLVVEANWACGVSQDTEFHNHNDTYPSFDTKNIEKEKLITDWK